MVCRAFREPAITQEIRLFATPSKLYHIGFQNLLKKIKNRRSGWRGGAGDRDDGTGKVMPEEPLANRGSSGGGFRFERDAGCLNFLDEQLEQGGEGFFDFSGKREAGLQGLGLYAE